MTTTSLPLESVLILLAIGAVVGAAACAAFFLATRSRQTDDLQATESAMAPIAESLQALAAQVERHERTNVAAQTELRSTLTTTWESQVQVLQRSTDEVRREASRLAEVLSRSGARGRWGEMQLRRLVEASGLLDRVDFVEQATVGSIDATGRPDMIIRLAGDRSVVIDAKVPLAAFLEAEQATDDATLQVRLQQHADAVVRHIDALRARDYQRLVPSTAEFVVMFLPSEALLETALQVRPDLLDYAFERNVVPATPTTLFALLRTVSLTWRQERLAEHAQEIRTLGIELHHRLATMAAHFARVGSSLDAAVANYNKAVGSLETRVLVTARQFGDLGTGDAPLEPPTLLHTTSRPLSAPELIADVG
ncbi:MAG: DNA recombination protein RmuC [Candidatus Nanopelagicales bacterium]|nr:DNA recombination protein RmuC [Candidatus Nanopelagicales bacterium]